MSELALQNYEVACKVAAGEIINRLLTTAATRRPLTWPSRFQFSSWGDLSCVWSKCDAGRRMKVMVRQSDGETQWWDWSIGTGDKQLEDQCQVVKNSAPYAWFCMWMSVLRAQNRRIPGALVASEVMEPECHLLCTAGPPDHRNCIYEERSTEYWKCLAHVTNHCS